MDLTKTGDWKKAAEILRGVDKRLPRIMHQAILQEAHFIRKQMLKAFANGGPVGKRWAPLSAMTLALRKASGFKGSKILIRTAGLRNAIAVTEIDEGVFVGIHRTAKGSGGKSPVNLGDIHEYGRNFTVRMTAKMRRFLFAMMHKAGIARERERGVARMPGGAGARVINIRIPARPFVGPTLEAFAKPPELAASVMNRVAILLEGQLGQADAKPRE